MVRHAAAVAVAVSLIPAWLSAQSTTFTVTTPSADVHKAPSTGSVVVGHAPRGTVLNVARELGSWVKVGWPDTEDSAGYVHVSWGSIAHNVPESKRPAEIRSGPARASAPPPSAPGPVSADSPRAVEQRPVEPARMREVYVTPATHGLGLGGLMGGSPLGFGATVRAWRPDRLGVQLDVSRYAVSGSGIPERVTSIQIEPSLLYSLPDRVTDSVWLRPYLGSGATLRRHSVSTGTPGADSLSGKGFGLQAFGGTELTLAGAPQFAVSANLSYHWFKTPVAGFDLGGLGVSVLGHWYVR